jgi:8-oxo-dGTP pyrophosphatase MutT (NUDIX family)
MSGPVEIFCIDQIDITVEPHDWTYARDHEAAIAADWRALKAGNDKVFDGRVLLLHRHDLQGGRFAGGGFETSFSAFYHWRKRGFPDLSVRNFFAMAALRAEDGVFLLGEMGADTASAGQIYFPAGTPDPSDIDGGKTDLLGSVLRELEEETGLSPADVDVRPGWDAIFCGGYLAFMREIRVPGRGAAAAARIEAALARQNHPELARIHQVGQVEAAEGLKMPPFMLPYLKYAFSQPG